MFTRLTFLACLVAPAAVAGVAGAATVVFPALAGGNDHVYEVVVEPSFTRDDAAAVAQTGGGYLATITSAAEQAFIESLLANNDVPTGSYWMGMERVGADEFRWVTGEPFEFSNFPFGEPNNYRGVEDAGQVYWSQSAADIAFPRRGTWNDVPVAGYAQDDVPDLIRTGFIIEHDPVGSGDGDPPVAIPLPPAVLAGPVALVMAGLMRRRSRKL
jgi:hypothetical protein